MRFPISHVTFNNHLFLPFFSSSPNIQWVSLFPTSLSISICFSPFFIFPKHPMRFPICHITFNIQLFALPSSHLISSHFLYYPSFPSRWSRRQSVSVSKWCHRCLLKVISSPSIESSKALPSTAQVRDTSDRWCKSFPFLLFCLV